MISELCATAVNFRQAMMSLNKGYLMKEKNRYFLWKQDSRTKIKKRRL